MTAEAPTSTGPAETLRLLRTRVREISTQYKVDLETRARLVVAVSATARPAIDANRHTELHHSVRPGTGTTAALLVVTLTLPADIAPDTVHNLPLVPELAPHGALTWRIPLAAATPVVSARDSVVDDVTAFENELCAALTRADALENEQKHLKHELAETNSGVLAMYIQLEKRDEQLRRSHAEIFQQLENALRPPPLSVPGLDFTVHYAPAGLDAPTGGDHYDWFLLPDGTVHITVVDAVGHGVASTGDALDVTATIRTLALEGHPLHELINRSATLLAKIDPRLMATVLLARIQPRTGLLQLATGSHPPALLVRQEHATYLEPSGRGVGFPLPGSEKIHTEPLLPGDLVLLYTDGLTEGNGIVADGERRLVTAALRHNGPELAATTTKIVQELHEERSHADDTLLIAIRYH